MFEFCTTVNANQSSDDGVCSKLVTSPLDCRIDRLHCSPNQLYNANHYRLFFENRLEMASLPVSAAQGSISSFFSQDLSPWGMFLAADWVVKSVMIGLVLASLLTWTVWLAKTVELGFAKRRVRRGLEALGRAKSLSEATQAMDYGHRSMINLINAAVLEAKMSFDTPGEGIKERVASRLERIEAEAGRTIQRGTGLLANVGSTAPFVGLFGTVWGIMNSFIGISKAQTTNLAVVAPGIAEALLATAIGLVAAIPAVLFYNVFSRSIGSYRALLADAAAEIMRLISRDLDRGTLISKSTGI